MVEDFLASTSTTAKPMIGRPLLIVSEVRLLREGIADVIERKSGLWVAGLCASLSDALSRIGECPWATVLLDASFPRGLDAVRTILAADPEASVVVFAVSETEENIVAWAKAGAVGYIPTTAALSELAGFIESVIRGEQICSAAVASRLMRRLGSARAWRGSQRLAPGADPDRAGARDHPHDLGGAQQQGNRAPAQYRALDHQIARPQSSGKTRSPAAGPGRPLGAQPLEPPSMRPGRYDRRNLSLWYASDTVGALQARKSFRRGDGPHCSYRHDFPASGHCQPVPRKQDRR